MTRAMLTSTCLGSSHPPCRQEMTTNDDNITITTIMQLAASPPPFWGHDGHNNYNHGSAASSTTATTINAVCPFTHRWNELRLTTAVARAASLPFGYHLSVTLTTTAHMHAMVSTILTMVTTTRTQLLLLGDKDNINATDSTPPPSLADNHHYTTTTTLPTIANDGNDQHQPPPPPPITTQRWPLQHPNAGDDSDDAQSIAFTYYSFYCILLY